MDMTSPLNTATRQVEPGRKMRRRHRLRTTLITFGVIIVLLVVGIAATGLYDVPVVSSVFGMNKPKDLGVRTSPEALESIKEKIPMKITGDTMEYGSAGSKAFTGSIPVDTQTTSEEITSWLERFEGSDPIFTDTQVKKFEGGLEISTMLQKYTKAPVYVKVLVTRTGPKSVALTLQKAKIGAFTVPEKYRQQAEDWFEKKIGEAMRAIDGFSMETYEIHDGVSVFKGTFPAVAAPATGGWSDLMKL